QPPAAVRLTRQLLKAADRAAVERTLGIEAQAFLGRLASPEAAEAFAAFAEKRAPDFSRFD
ncbi:MAG TPA: enoyl-CoA hydratase, partial [Plasticicumulans sp.]|nr:enoyl-CoA hydratase [Plasticicumulans sp.]